MCSRNPYDLGVIAYIEGYDVEACPFDSTSKQAEEWLNGFWDEFFRSMSDV